jgi:hypothetical protein
MAKNEQNKKDKAVIVVKVIGLAVLMLSALFMVGMLNIGDLFAQVLGYGLMVVTIYFALSVVK